MNYRVNNKTVKLSQNDFLAKGGQGSVYIKGSTVFKIYTDPKEMITKSKVLELQAITDSRVLVPQDFILDKDTNTPVGFTMPYKDNTVPLIKLFNTGYRDRAGFDEKGTLNIVEQMQHVIQHVHDKGVLQIDGNELNYIVGDSLNTPYLIDVDSYQTKSHKASVIMPSIRDWQTSTFSTLTDWYSFGIIACQLFVGLHPYKGRHPQFKRDLKNRMLANVSIFNKDTSVPGAVRDFSNIPSEYMTWFIDMFEKGKRLPPPLVAGTLVLKPTLTVAIGSNLMKITKVARTKKYLNSVILPWNNNEVKVSIYNSKISIEENGIVIFNELACSEFMISNNTIYAKNNDKIHEVSLGCFNNKTVAKYKSWSISPKSSIVMTGMVYQNLLGHSILTIPFIIGSSISKPVPELDGYKIIDGKYENKVAMLIGLNVKTQKYGRITLVFNNDHTEYSVKHQSDVEYYLNFTVLETGIVLAIYEDGILTMFTNNISAHKVKELKDDEVSTSWRLTHEGSKAMFYKDNSLYTLSMKR